MADDKSCKVISPKRIKLSTSMDDLQSEENTDPNSTRSPEESVFSIDHILESIFLKCDRQTLKNCRLVSRRWAYYGSKELQKTVQIGLLEHIHIDIHHTDEPKYFHMGSNGPRFMEDLIILMNNSTEFPAHSFKLTRIFQFKTQLGTQSFFDAHGAIIKKIAFGGCASIDDLKQLVLSKAPNLEQLSLETVAIINKSFVNNSVDLETHVQGLERRRLEESLYDEKVGGPKPILRTLKVFNCSFSGRIPEVFIQQILEYSPNLVEVVLPEDCLHLLIKPPNRLHLLKKLKLRIQNNNIESVEAVANQHGGNWALHELQYLPYINYQRFNGGDNTEFSSRVAFIMRKIYEGNSATCQKLDLGRHLENVKIPQMPQVERLSFLHSPNEETGVPYRFLPEGVSLQDAFPNLKWLKIIPVLSIEQNLHIEDIFGYHDPAPVLSVKKVILRFFTLREGLRQSFKTMFPNATIHNRFTMDHDDDGSEEGGRKNEENDSDSDSNDHVSYDDDVSDVDGSGVDGSDVDGSDIEASDVETSDVDGSDADGSTVDERPDV